MAIDFEGTATECIFTNTLAFKFSTDTIRSVSTKLKVNSG